MQVLLRIAAMLSLGFALFPAPNLWSQNTNADYASAPPFVSATVTPDILLLVDNSGSMLLRVACPTDPVCPAWDETRTYTGLFESMKCYDYDATDSRFENAAIKGGITDLCPTSRWDGNFLNWLSTRRMDTVKQAMTGGFCAAPTGRNPDGSCPPIGTPSLVTLKGEDADLTLVAGDRSTSYTAPICPLCVDTGVLTGAGVNHAKGRVPNSVQGSAAKLYFHLRGTGILKGSFCVDDDMDSPITGAGSCDTDSLGASPELLGVQTITPEQFIVHVVARTANPVGVIQKVGGKARFGLMQFKAISEGDGAKVMVPIGGRQVLSFNSTVVTNYSNNTVAMIAAIDATVPATFTPLAETLYTGLRYVAQIAQPYDTTTYQYPLAFLPGVAAPATGQGSLGPAEINYLSLTETCPAPYVGKRCSRDPYFFASNNDGSPPLPVPGPWLAPPAVVQCCKTFVILFTDGEPTEDLNIPASIKTLASPFSVTASFLDDVAYWGHKTDLRPESVLDPACKATPKGAPTTIKPIANIGESGHPLCGMQNVTIYTLFAFGGSAGSEVLRQTAKLGGFTEQDGVTGPNLQTEWDKVNVDGTTGSTVALCNADCIPDNYYEAQDAATMEQQLLAAITDIGAKAASGSAAGVLTATVSGEGALYQAYFFPTIPSGLKEVKWVGYLQSLWIDRFGNLREDHSAPLCVGPPDGRLIVEHDCIIRIRYDSVLNTVKVDRFPTATPVTVDFVDIKPLWEAGRNLALMGDPGNNCAPDAGGITCRRILTWIDVTNGGAVGPGVREFNEFTAVGSVDGIQRIEDICPYLGGEHVLDCNSPAVPAKASALAEATRIINFVRGRQVLGFRDRVLPVVDDAGVTQTTLVWKLGDIVNSSPTVVGAPAERYDVIFGDAAYSEYFQLYKDRRQVTYVGGNDGMLHAFNSGFFYPGDDPATGTLLAPVNEQALFTTEPKKLNGGGTALITCASLPCDGGSGTTYTTTRTGAAAPRLGAELWGFIPQDLLPQLRWLTSPSYDHVYFVDSKPKTTDVRIFCGDALSPPSCIDGQATKHPGGWGTILIGSLRFGGSCSNCNSVKGKPRTVTADFNLDGTTTDTGDGALGQNSDTRVFLSSYFVLDITNPEKDPVLLWVFKDKDLGFTTAAPGILRLNPATDQMTLSTNQKWYLVFGTGPTDHDGSSSQTGKLFVVDLVLGPQYAQVNNTTTGTCSAISPCITANIATATKAVRQFSTGLAGAFMGDVITSDVNLNFKDDVVYVGSTSCNALVTSPCGATGPAWKGAMHRLTTNNGNPDPDTWGVLIAAARSPTTLVSKFTSAGVSPCLGSICPMGPVTAAAQVSSDELHNIWVFFGSGRYLANSDKTNADAQYFLGVVDCIMGGQCVDQTVERSALFDVSNIEVCDVTKVGCADAQNNVSLAGGAAGTYTSGFDSGSGNLVETMNQVTAGVRNFDGWFTRLPKVRERDLNRAVILGGTLFFTTFTPAQGVCEASGTGDLYALYYLTGTAYKTSSVGDTLVAGVGKINKSISLGEGMPSAVAVHFGAKGLTEDGQTLDGTGSKFGTSILVSGSGGSLQGIAVHGGAASNPFSAILSWRDL